MRECGRVIVVGLWALLAGCSDASDVSHGAAGASNADNAGASNTSSAGASNTSSAGAMSSAGADSNSAFSCSAPPPACGGNVVGTWKIEQSCIATLMGTSSCGGLTGDGSGLTQTGNVIYNADMSYTSSTSISGTLKTVYPSSCTAGLACDDFASALAAALPSGYSAPDCTAVASGCACTFEVSAQPAEESGTYTLSGNVLTQNRSSGTSIDIEYCARDRSLTLVARNPGTGTQAQAALLEKQ